MPKSNDLPMSHTLKSNDWETLDSMCGINLPMRHIKISTQGFRLRKKVLFLGGEGNPTPCAVNYGGISSVLGYVIQVKGNKNQTVYFLQGEGEV